MFSRHNSEPQEPLTDFFHQFNAPLKTIPVQDRAELHTEMRQHLDALVAAHLELGASPEEALDAAIKQFGNPRKIAVNLVREWRRTAYQSSGTLWKAIWHMIGCKWLMIGLSVAAGIPLANHSSNSFFFGLSVAAGIPLANHSSNSFFDSFFLYYLVYFISPLLAGMITGWKMPEKAAPGAFYAGLLFVLPFMMLLFQSASAFPCLVIALDWLAVSYVGAYAASAYRRGGFYRVHFSDFRLRRR